MAKKFYDNGESKMLADLEILPLSHFLYMSLRLCFDRAPDCGLFKVRVKEMISITGLDRSIITDTLLPELVRHYLIVYDNSVLFIPGTAETECFEKKLHSANPHYKQSFMSALIDCESVVSITSGYGGINEAVKKFIEYWSDSIDRMISEMTIFENELLVLEENDKIEVPDSNRSKRIFTLKKSISAFYSCRTLLARKHSLAEQSATTYQPPEHLLTEKSTPPTNPLTEKSTPPTNSLSTHYQPTTNPLRENTPPSYGNGNGLWDMGINKEIPIGFIGGAGEKFSQSKIPEQANSFCFVDTGGVSIEDDKLCLETAQDGGKPLLADTDTDVEFQTIRKDTHNENSTINNELRNYGLVSDDSLEGGNEDVDSEFLNTGGD
ncbi:MAG: hypothetical protein IPM69_11840 [Ignavibacteria bacterium]|nr:hypothetical protein [Ignavibacteria bacterium]